MSERAEAIFQGYLAHSTKKWFFALELLVVGALSFTYFYIYQFSSTHLCGTDPYYHIKFAYLTRVQGVITDFHWAQFSFWKDHFFDKEFLYHLYLSLFTFGDLTRGAKWATLVIGCGTFLSFFAVLRLNRVRYRWLWWILLLSGGGYLLFRINVTRPQTLSVLIMVVGLHFLINERHWVVGLISFLYALSYTGHYQFVGLAFIYIFVVRIKDGRWVWRPAVWALGGMLLGWLVHPNFPHNIQGFFVQNVMVIIHHVSPTVQLNMGGELNPMSTRSMINVCSATLIPMWIVFSLAMFTKHATDTRSVFLFAASTVYLVLTMITKRFGEYWIPVTGLMVAFYFATTPKEWTLGHWWRNHRWAFWLSLAVLAAGLPVLFLRSHFDTFRQLNRCGEPTFAPSARWVDRNIPPGETVLTCDWDDAPYLFFYAHRQNYAVFLDPTFMYRWNPEVWHRWDSLTHAKERKPVRTLLNYFKVRYIYCSGDFGAFRSQMRRTPGAQQIYPLPAPGSLGRSCAVNTDCAEGTICDNKQCKPGKPCRTRTGKCITDRHVFIFKVERPSTGDSRPKPR